MAATTARYMWLRTYRYSPPSTLVGGDELVPRQPVSHHGPSPATVPGARAMNTELPTAATHRRMRPVCAPHERLVQAGLRAAELRTMPAARAGPGNKMIVKTTSLEWKIVSNSDYVVDPGGEQCQHWQEVLTLP